MTSLDHLADLMTAVAADHPEVDTAVIIVATVDGQVEYRSRLAEEDLNRYLVEMIKPLQIGERDPNGPYPS